jgi:hypothetical protein
LFSAEYLGCSLRETKREFIKTLLFNNSIISLSKDPQTGEICGSEYKNDSEFIHPIDRIRAKFLYDFYQKCHEIK